MEHTILKATDLTFSYTGGPLMTFPTIHLQKNEHGLLLGDSGAGKSTLLNLLAGLSKPLTGEVFFEETPIYSLSSTERDRWRAKQVGFIFQEAHLLKNLTILENIKLAQSLAGFPVDTEAIKALLSYLQLGDKLSAYPNDLSRGQVQRVAIARAVINKPALLIADEPTAALDDKNTSLVLDLLKETAALYQSTLLIATHDKRVKDVFTNTIYLNAIARN